MSDSDLISALKKRIEFDNDAAFKIAKKSKSLMDYGLTSCAVDAIEADRARLQPVLLAMVEVCRELEQFQSDDFNNSSDPVKTKMYDALACLKEAVELGESK